MQITHNAINRSIMQTEIAHISAVDMAQAGVDYDAVSADLYSECESHVEANGTHEFWGVDVDGNEWRVHVEMPANIEITDAVPLHRYYEVSERRFVDRDDAVTYQAYIAAHGYQRPSLLTGLVDDQDACGARDQLDHVSDWVAAGRPERDPSEFVD